MDRAAALDVLSRHVDPSHILLGTDSPFVGPMAPTIAGLHERNLPTATLDGIERDNAFSLFGLQRSSPAPTWKGTR